MAGNSALYKKTSSHASKLHYSSVSASIPALSSWLLSMMDKNLSGKIISVFFMLLSVMGFIKAMETELK